MPADAAEIAACQRCRGRTVGPRDVDVDWDKQREALDRIIELVSQSPSPENQRLIADTAREGLKLVST